jgi:hypothetical protein
MTERHIAHSCALALRQLFRSHLALISNIIRRRITSRQRGRINKHRISFGAHTSSSSSSTRSVVRRPRIDSHSAGSTAEVQPHRALEVDDISTAKNIALIETYWDIAIPILQKSGWTPAQAVVANNGLSALLRVIAATNHHGSRNQYLLESSRYALDVLSIITFLPNVCGLLSDVELSIDRRTTGMSVLIVTASGTIHNDPKIIILALQVLCHMVTPHRLNKEYANAKENKEQEKIQRRLRTEARAHDAITVSLKLLEYKGTPKSADAIRHLASRFLFGLAHDQDVAQILTKLNVTNLMSNLATKGPVVQVNRHLHKRFSEYAERLYNLLSLNSLGYSSSSSSATTSLSSSSSFLNVSSSAAVAIEPTVPPTMLKIMNSKSTLNAIKQLRELSYVNANKNKRGATDGEHSFDNVMKSLVYGYLESQGLKHTMMKMCEETGLSQSVLESYQKVLSNPLKNSTVLPLTNWPTKSNSAIIKRKRWRRTPTINGTGGMGNIIKLEVQQQQRRRRHQQLSTNKNNSDLRVQTLVGKKRTPAMRSPLRSNGNSKSSSKRIKMSLGISPLRSALPEQLLDFDAEFQASISSPALSSRRFSVASSSSLSSLHSNKKGRQISLHFKRQSAFSLAHGGNSSSTVLASDGVTSSSNISVLVGVVHRGLIGASQRFYGSPKISKGSCSNKHYSKKYHRQKSAKRQSSTREKGNFAQTLRSRVFAVDRIGTTNNYRSCHNHDTLIVSHGDQHMMSQRARSMVFSQFRHMRSYRSDDVMYTCSSFLSSLGGKPTHLIAVGQENGTCSFLNMWHSDIYMDIDAHSAAIDTVKTSRNQRLVLTNGSDGEMKLWDTTNPLFTGNRNSKSKPSGLKLHASYQDCFNPEFSHDDKLIVSSYIVHESSNLPVQIQIGQRYRTTIHDIETKVPIYTLEDPSGSIMYRSGSCCFDPLDEKVFCDGKLWDLRSNKIINRFDRLGNEGHAIFHPRRNELIIDSAVWDLRMTSRLLKVVPALEDSVSTFSAVGDALYTFKIDNHDQRRYQNQVVRVLDGWNHGDIGQPIELEEYHAKSLCTDLHDDYIAITVDANFQNESCVKLFEVGRKTPHEADSDMDDAQSESEAPDMSEDDEFGFMSDDDADDMYYDTRGNHSNHGSGLFDEEPDLDDILFG